MIRTYSYLVFVKEKPSWNTLSGKRMSGESDENYEGVTKFFPDEEFPRHFITWSKLLPDFFILFETFTQSFIFQQKLNPNFYTAWITEISALNVELQDFFFELVKETNSFGGSD